MRAVSVFPLDEFRLALRSIWSGSAQRAIYRIIPGNFIFQP